jgi:hypothetical protein
MAQILYPTRWSAHALFIALFGEGALRRSQAAPGLGPPEIHAIASGAVAPTPRHLVLLAQAIERRRIELTELVDGQPVVRAEARTGAWVSFSQGCRVLRAALERHHVSGSAGAPPIAAPGIRAV